MSMRLVHSAQNAPLTGYLVAAPARSDVLSATLRCAYGDASREPVGFDDLLRVLNRIELPR